jgi:cell division protein FtsQ
MAQQRRGASINQMTEDRSGQWRLIVKPLMSLTLVAMLIASVMYLYQVDTLPIKHVTVEGDLNHVDKATLINAVSPYVTGSFFSVNVSKVQAAGQALPWVKQIQVRRTWPDGIHLIVHEEVAIAKWNDDSLLNDLGHVFKPAAETFPTGLVQVNGPKGMGEMMARKMADIQINVQPLGLMVSHITMDQRRAWKVTFENGLQLKLGREDNDARLARFIDVYQGALATVQSQIEVIDMRYTNGLAVTWIDGQPPQFDGTV